MLTLQTHYIRISHIKSLTQMQMQQIHSPKVGLIQDGQEKSGEEENIALQLIQSFYT